MSWYDEDENECVPYAPSWISRKVKSGNPDLTKHYPNKNESKVLRKLMSQTGLTEKEIREHKKYRIMLTKAQNIKGNKSKEQRIALNLLKRVLRELKLPKEHPAVLDKLKEFYKEMVYESNWYYGRIKHYYSPQQIIELSKGK